MKTPHFVPEVNVNGYPIITVGGKTVGQFGKVSKNDKNSAQIMAGAEVYCHWVGREEKYGGFRINKQIIESVKKTQAEYLVVRDNKNKGMCIYKMDNLEYADEIVRKENKAKEVIIDPDDSFMSFEQHSITGYNHCDGENGGENRVYRKM